jgi:nucleotide-binding universal stress UspA family protein
MLKPREILIASHGTDGARAAEAMALDLCPQGGTLHHLIVVPDFWRGMMGDDWLNNASTREIYGDYVENQLQDEVRAEIQRLRQLAERRGVGYRFAMHLGKPTACLIEHAGAEVDMVVIGSPRPRGVPGQRSRVNTEQLVRHLRVPLLIVPYPQ